MTHMSSSGGPWRGPCIPVADQLGRCDLRASTWTDSDGREHCDLCGCLVAADVIPQQQRVREIQARAEKATPGPWAWESIAEKSNEFAVGTAFAESGKQLAGRLPEGEWVEDAVIERRALVGMNESGHASFADADFIAHAREDVPWLLKQLAEKASSPPRVPLSAEHQVIGSATERLDRCLPSPPTLG